MNNENNINQIALHQIWQPVTDLPISDNILPNHFVAYSLNLTVLQELLDKAPKEFLENTHSLIIPLPKPDGSFSRFRVVEYSCMAPELAAKYPEIKSYRGQGIDEPDLIATISINPYFGLDVQVLSIDTFYITPIKKGNINIYMSYFRRDLPPQGNFICHTK